MSTRSKQLPTAETFREAEECATLICRNKLPGVALRGLAGNFHKRVKLFELVNRVTARELVRPMPFLELKEYNIPDPAEEPDFNYNFPAHIDPGLAGLVLHHTVVGPTIPVELAYPLGKVRSDYLHDATEDPFRGQSSPEYDILFSAGRVDRINGEPLKPAVHKFDRGNNPEPATYNRYSTPNPCFLPPDYNWEAASQELLARHAEMS